MKKYQLQIKKVLQLLVLFSLFSLTACKEQILHNLTEQEAHRVIARLRDSKIEAEKVKQPDLKWAIAVSREHAIEAIAAVNQMRLKKDPEQQQNQKSSFVSSPEEQRFAYEQKVARELQATLESITGVLEARVHLNLPPSDPLLGVRSQVPGSASVLLVVDQDTDIQDAEVATLVAGAAGLNANAISVLIKHSAALNHSKTQEQGLQNESVDKEDDLKQGINVIESVEQNRISSSGAPETEQMQQNSKVKDWQNVLLGNLKYFTAVLLGLVLIIAYKLVQNNRKRKITSIIAYGDLK